MKLYDFQKKVLEETESYNRVAYYLEMGLGKTFVGAEKLNQLGAESNLLICQKSKIKDWSEHFKTYYADYQVIDLTSKKGFEELEQARGKTVSIINYELAWRRPKLADLSDFTLMLDESSLIQNHKAKQTKFILKMNPKNVILLSGTPVGGKYENLWSQAKLLGWNIKLSTFQTQYINFEILYFGNTKIRTVARRNPYKNIERLKRKLREHGAIFMKTEEVIELPEQRFINVKIPATKSYTKFMKTCIVTVDDEELVGDTLLKKHLISRQLCGFYNKNKIQALKDLIESTSDRLIIFYNFNAELEVIKSIIKDRPTSEVNGHNKDLTAYENEEDSITLVQYQAGAMGLNLQKANKIIYFTLTERSELFEQSKKRIHRVGQDKKCTYYLLITEDSIEEDILRALERREDFTNELFKEIDNAGDSYGTGNCSNCNC